MQSFSDCFIFSLILFLTGCICSTIALCLCNHFQTSRFCLLPSLVVCPWDRMNPTWNGSTALRHRLESDDDMQSSGVWSATSASCDNCVVLVDEQKYTYNKDRYDDDTWAAFERKQDYVVYILNNKGVPTPWCRLCGKYGECVSHFKGAEHMRHVLEPSEIYLNKHRWKVPKSVNGHLM